MKKVSYIVMVISATLLIVLNCVACSDYSDKDKIENRSATCQQPGSFFPEGEQRYILVDESAQKLGLTEQHCWIYADKYTHVMYEVIEFKSHSSSYTRGGWTMIQLEYEDGSPMLYDNGEW